MFGGFPIPLDSRKKYKIKTQTFTASGTWTKPANFTGDYVWVTQTGAGGSGAANTADDSIQTGGGSGHYTINTPYDVSEVSTVSVTIGTGGAGLGNVASNGNDGGDTSFGSLVSPGGKGGRRIAAATAGNAFGEGAHHGGKYSYNGAVSLDPPQSCPLGYPAGSSVISGTASAVKMHLGGGGGLFGAGVAGNSKTNAPANSGAGSSGTGGQGGTGNGGSGKCIVMWQETV